VTEFLIDARQAGKTATVLGWARGDVHRQIVAFSEREADRLRDKLRYPPAGAAVYDRAKVVTIDTILRGHGRSSGSGVDFMDLAVDNLDLMLQVIFKRPVHLVTATQGSPYTGRNFYATGGSL
jgi:hypothetical protein